MSLSHNGAVTDISKYFAAEPNNFLPPGTEQNRNEKRLWFLRGNSSYSGKRVLLIAHSDTVRPPCFHGLSANDEDIFASGLDDRLGCYLAVLIQIKRPAVDILITDGEESNDSSASEITKDELARYSCAIGLDRAGLDWVDYGLAGKELTAAVEKYCGEKRHGSYSDICKLPSGICGLANIGIGYDDGHSHGAYVSLADMAEAYRRALCIVDACTGKDFPAPPVRPPVNFYSHWNDEGYGRGNNLYSFEGGMSAYSDEWGDPIPASDKARLVTPADNWKARKELRKAEWRRKAIERQARKAIEIDLASPQIVPPNSCRLCSADLAISLEREEGLCMDCMAQEYRRGKADVW